MIRYRFPALLVSLIIPVSLAGQSSAKPDSSATWSRALEGSWSCAGAFASGKTLAADLNFTRVLGGRWLSYHHKDRPPGQYEATSLWGPAQWDTTMSPTLLYDNFGGHRRFFPGSTGSEVVLTRDTTDAGARLERFTFRPRPDGTLWFAWEVSRQGAWALGDSLSCSRQG